MALHANLWSPDTCECQHEYVWDDSVPIDQRVHTFTRSTKACPVHAGLNGVAKYNHALEQNQRKNIALSEALDHMPFLGEDVLDEFGEPTGGKQLRKDTRYVFAFDGVDDQRVLKISFTGKGAQSINNSHKSTFKTRLDKKFGVDKVVIM